jgi:hypothetical protein
MGIWTEIKPKGARSPEWQFAEYSEAPSERGDGQWYTAFLFRNGKRTEFGIREWLGELPHRQELRHLAMRVVVNRSLRKSLLSDRPDLPKWWKRK